MVATVERGLMKPSHGARFASSVHLSRSVNLGDLAPACLLGRCFRHASVRPASWVLPPLTPVEQELHAAY